ncbi:hypothetical protein [Methylobacterium radiodurans]|uniref:hypothetical protein n=1 Tax=Methylobacterium radiodurans TaxID=2202828 RepID=UPI0013A5869B|nr:hypothetical protein [Methylobacterium radiodurans]
MRLGARSILLKFAAVLLLCAGFGVTVAPRGAEAAPLAVPAGVEMPASGLETVQYRHHHRHHGMHRGWHHRRHFHHHHRHFRPRHWHRHHHHHRRGFYRY